ncbi:MAG TPA: hypothetical protein ENF97_00055, partial [Candidatus Omnitrophica bacterium]|nr:hypothetical protein [Candidatus Omnitrophota bacterium]
VDEEIKKFLPVKEIDRWSGAKLVLKARENPDSLSALERKTIKLLYLSQIKYLELKMDEFLNYLFNNSLMEETLLIFSADHGTELLEHGVFGHAPIWYKENEIKLFNTVLKIPFLIYGRKIDGKRNENLASSIDIAPTICALLGIKSPENWLGQNLLASDFKREMVISEQIYFEEDKIQDAFAFQTQDEKFIYDLSRGIYYYYDLKKDPEEMENCMDIHPQKRKEIERCYLSHNRLILDTYQKPETSIMVDSEIKRRLESLGYL